MSMPGTIIVGLTSSTAINPETSGGNPDVHPFHNDTSTDSSSSSDAAAHVGWIIVVILVALAFGTFLCLAAYLEKRRLLGASRRARRANTATTRPKKKPTSERYLEIEKWLVNKRVEAHDEVCDHACSLLHSRMGKNNNDDKANRQRSLTECTSKTDHSQSSDEEEGHLDECSICFDVFQPGEIVSWSPEPKCQHVFHHHCIKEWLLKKKECPFCRETFLPVDRLEQMTQRKTISALILAQQLRSVHCFYCVEHGVVRPSRRDCELQAIRQRSECVPTLEELQKIRGVVDSDKNDDSLHSVPSPTALSSVDENSDIEMCHEIRGMPPHAEIPVVGTQTDSSLVDHDEAPSEVSEHFPDSAPEDV